MVKCQRINKRSNRLKVLSSALHSACRAVHCHVRDVRNLLRGLRVHPVHLVDRMQNIPDNRIQRLQLIRRQLCNGNCPLILSQDLSQFLPKFLVEPLFQFAPLKPVIAFVLLIQILNCTQAFLPALILCRSEAVLLHGLFVLSNCIRSAVCVDCPPLVGIGPIRIDVSALQYADAEFSVRCLSHCLRDKVECGSQLKHRSLHKCRDVFLVGRTCEHVHKALDRCLQHPQLVLSLLLLTNRCYSPCVLRPKSCNLLGHSFGSAPALSYLGKLFLVSLLILLLDLLPVLRVACSHPPSLIDELLLLFCFQLQLLLPGRVLVVSRHDLHGYILRRLSCILPESILVLRLHGVVGIHKRKRHVIR